MKTTVPRDQTIYEYLFTIMAAMCGLVVVQVNVLGTSWHFLCAQMFPIASLSQLVTPWRKFSQEINSHNFKAVFFTIMVDTLRVARVAARDHERSRLNLLPSVASEPDFSHSR